MILKQTRRSEHDGIFWWWNEEVRNVYTNLFRWNNLRMEVLKNIVRNRQLSHFWVGLEHGTYPIIYNLIHFLQYFTFTPNLDRDLYLQKERFSESPHNRSHTAHTNSYQCRLKNTRECQHTHTYDNVILHPLLWVLIVMGRTGGERETNKASFCL